MRAASRAPIAQDTIPWADLRRTGFHIHPSSLHKRAENEHILGPGGCHIEEPAFIFDCTLIPLGVKEISADHDLFLFSCVL